MNLPLHNLLTYNIYLTGEMARGKKERESWVEVTSEHNSVDG